MAETKGQEDLESEIKERKDPKVKVRFQCDLCLKSFAFQYQFANHKRVHTGEIPFSCHIRPSAFFKKRSLETHKRTHTGEKPFGCDLCPSAFSKKA